MLSAILGGLAAAMHKTGEAIEDAGQIMGAPQWLTGGLSGAFTALGRGADSMGEGVANSGGFSLGGSIGGGLGERFTGLFGGSDGPSLAPARTPGLQVEAPVIQHAAYHVDPADLGNFSAPTFGGSSRGGAGIGI